MIRTYSIKIEINETERQGADESTTIFAVMTQIEQQIVGVESIDLIEEM